MNERTEARRTANAPDREMPRGLVLFPPGTPRAVRRRRLIFVALCVPAFAALMWPVFSWVASPFPLILSLPKPLAWVIGVVLWVFLALWWLDRPDAADGDGAS